MKIIYNSKTQFPLSDYGILVPLLKSRSASVVEYLKSNKNFNKCLYQGEIYTLTKEDLYRVHQQEYINRLYDQNNCEKEIIKTYELINERGEYHRYDPKIAKRPLHLLANEIIEQAGYSFTAMKLALKEDVVYFLGGGMHHAHFDYGSGFCLINDIVIGLRRLQAEKKVQNCWVIDLDAHKGDGTAAITRYDTSIHTLSIHMKSGWPLDGDMTDNPSFIASTIDIPIAQGHEDKYCDLLQAGLIELEKVAGQADLVVVLDGADASARDKLAGTALLKLNDQQMLQRTQLVYQFLKNRKIPQAYLTAGGYGEDVWFVHAQFLEFLLMSK